MSGAVVIIGGGLAGLAAASALAEHGVPSTVLESRLRLGGRASSFQESAQDEWVDNCQHVAMGCCTNFFHFCTATGIREEFVPQDRLNFVAPGGRVTPFSAGPWPAPLHLTGAFLRQAGLSWRDKYAIARGLTALARTPGSDDGRSFADWLASQRQTPGAIERFWHVVLVSALSETLDRISIPHARKVFVDGFLRHRAGWKVFIPKVPLESLYGPIQTALEQRGVTVRKNAAAVGFTWEAGRITGVTLRSGETLGADDVILAVPWHRVADLLPVSLANDPWWSRFQQIESAPISSVHFWFDRPIMALPHATFTTGLVQWVFARPATVKHADAHYYQVVISASREVLAASSESIRSRVLDELAAVWPMVKTTTLQHWRLVTEHRAVFSVTPGVESLRPPQRTPVENLQLAGDWTQTGWPATMEGAVRSGYLAAENLLARRGTSTPCLQPDLPTATLSRWLYGL